MSSLPSGMGDAAASRINHFPVFSHDHGARALLIQPLEGRVQLLFQVHPKAFRGKILQRSPVLHSKLKNLHFHSLDRYPYDPSGVADQALLRQIKEEPTGIELELDRFEPYRSMHVVDLDGLQNQRMDVFFRGFPFLPGTVYSGFCTGVHIERKDQGALSLGIPNIRMDRPSLEMVEVQKVDEILLA